MALALPHGDRQQLWEEPEDRRNETAIVAELVRRGILASTPVREPGERSTWDYRLDSGRLFDIKVRNCGWYRWPDNPVSTSKWEWLLNFREWEGRKVDEPFIFFHFTDGLVRLNFPDDVSEAKVDPIGRRNSRPGLRTPCVLIPNWRGVSIWRGNPLGLRFGVTE